MKSLLKTKNSLLISFFLLSFGVFGQNKITAEQKVLFEHINSFIQYVDSNLNPKCGNKQNLSFRVDSSIFSDQNEYVEVGENRLVCEENMIIYQPYGEYIPGRYYNETKIELLDIEEIVFSLIITTVGNRYEYYECNELYYFKLNGDSWEQIVY